MTDTAKSDAPLVIRAQHWKAEETTYRLPKGPALALVYDPTPGGRKNEGGGTTYSLRFPALILTDIVGDRQNVAKALAVELNAFPVMLEALKECASRLRYDGDLFDNQGNEGRRDASWRAMELALAAIDAATGAKITSDADQPGT